MAADGQITNEKGDPLDLPTVINSTPGLIHTSQPDGYHTISRMGALCVSELGLAHGNVRAIQKHVV